MGGECSTYEGEERGILDFSGETWGKEITWERKRRSEDNIKLDLPEERCEGMDSIDVAQDRDSWRALVNTVMKLRGQIN